MYYVVFRKGEEKQVERILQEGLEVDSIKKNDLFKDMSNILGMYNPKNVIIIEVNISGNINNIDFVKSQYLSKYPKHQDCKQSKSEKNIRHQINRSVTIMILPQMMNQRIQV